MAERLSLLEFLQKMIDNVGLRDWFADDPQAAMAHYGLKDVPVEDVRDAITLAEDNQVAEFNRHYDTGLHATLPAMATADHHAAPHSASHSEHHSEHQSKGDDGGEHHSAHQQAIEHLSRYVTNNHIDDRDTTVDDSLNQQVHTDGGDFTQAVESHSTTASGDGSVAAGEGITDSVLTTGDGNQVGTGNVAGNHNVVGDDNAVVSGNGATTSFGDGAATSAHIKGAAVGAGGALSVGGPADAEQVAVDSHDSVDTTTTDTTDISDSGNLHADVETGSHNDTTTDTSVDSHDTVHLDEASHNTVTVPVDLP